MADHEHPPRVFISYSHDSYSHQGLVHALADRLRRDGVDCHVDLYEEAPEKGWSQWMVDQIRDADYVLIVCTEIYSKRFERRGDPPEARGAVWEGAVLTQQLYESAAISKKLIPVVFAGADADHIPIILRGFTRYTLDGESGYEALYRRLTGQPRTIPPPLGKIRPLPPIPSRPMSEFFGGDNPRGGIEVSARVTGQWIHLAVANEGPTAEFVAQVQAVFGVEEEQTVPWSIRWRESTHEARTIVSGHEQLLNLAEGDPLGDPSARNWQPGGFWFYSTTARFRVRPGGLRRLDDIYQRRIQLIVKVSSLSGLTSTTTAIDIGFNHEARPVASVRDIGSPSFIPRIPSDHWVATFGVNTDNLLDSDLLPLEVRDRLGSSYPDLCDWLTQRLVHELNRTMLAPVSVLEDARTGETLSVRVEFRWDPSRGWPPVESSDAWWEILELVPFDQLSE